MMNPEREASDKQLPDDLTVSIEIQDCAKFFCTTLGSLNKIYEEYIGWLLKITITAAEAARSLSISKPDEDAKSLAGTKGDELTAIVEQLRSAVEGLNQNNIGQQAEIKADTQSAATNSETFCSQVEATLIVAMRNTVYAQQQAYVTGQAAITMAIAKILSIPLPKNSEGQGTEGISK
jgi:Killing trait